MLRLPPSVPTTSVVLILALIALVSLVISYIGAAVGLVLGQLRLILLVLWIGPLAGAATSLAVSSVGALFGALRHARDGRVSARLVLSFGVPSALAAFASASLAPTIDPQWLEAAIALTLLLSGMVMEIKRRRARAAAATVSSGEDAPAANTAADPPADPPAAPAADAPAHDPPRAKRRSTLLVEMAAGSALGALAGIVGLLLGTLRLPLLLRLAPTPAVAVGSNMAIGALTGALAGVAALREGTVDPLAFAVLAPVTMIAAHLGARTTGTLKRDTLLAMIAWVLILSGLLMVAQALLP